MVTHDSSLARRVNRTVLIHDGEIISEYVAQALPTLNRDQMLAATRQLQPETFAPGQVIIEEGSLGDCFYIVTAGQADVVLHRPNGSDVVVTQFHPGQFFGEIELLRGGAQHIATIRTSESGPCQVACIDRAVFDGLIKDSDATLQALQAEAERRLAENTQTRGR
jgi:CRP-like cAMP-binding protein